jgi:hypothetical protein
MVAMPFYLQLASGQVYFMPKDQPIQYSGTGAIYVRGNVVVTAAHCVPDDADAKYAFKAPGVKDAWVAHTVVRHPEADLAVMVGHPDIPMPSTGVYRGVDETLAEAGDFCAFGYPAEQDTAVGRVFKGHFQRYFGYVDPAGKSYFAGEMSVPAPAGLSGGPVSRPATPDLLSGIVTANHDSYLIVDSFEETEINGMVSKGQIKRVVSYGIAAMLVNPAMRQWLEEIVDGAG